MYKHIFCLRNIPTLICKSTYIFCLKHSLRNSKKAFINADKYVIKQKYFSCKIKKARQERARVFVPLKLRVLMKPEVHKTRRTRLQSF